mmetsp:Transcript_34558/g.91778  ORF Transcript_34558/g.91778 Transcript_34558/m.91778 type:complete len:1041 (-) Transcript_34558:673-3795(-)
MSSLELRSGSIPSANDKPEHEQQSLSLHDPKHDHDTIWSTDHSHHSHDHEHERESLSAPKREHFSNVDANLARLHPLDVLLFSGNDMIARGIKNIVASSNRISGFHHIGLCLKDPMLPTSTLIEGAAQGLTGDRGAFMFIRVNIRYDSAVDHLGEQTLRIQVLGARNLRPKDAFLPQDPYFRLAMIPNRAHAKKVIKSRVSWMGGNNPTFDNRVWYELKVKADLTDEEIEATCFHVEVWDKDVFSESDLISEAEIPLAYIFHQKKVEKWVIMKRGADVWKSKLIKEPQRATQDAASHEGAMVAGADSSYRPIQTLTGFLAKAPFTTQQCVHSAIAQHEEDWVMRFGGPRAEGAEGSHKVQSVKERLEGYMETRIYVFVLTTVAVLMFMRALFDNWVDFTGSDKNPMSEDTKTALYSLEVVAFVGWLLDLITRFYVQGANVEFFYRWLNAFDTLTLIVDVMLILQRLPDPLFSDRTAHRLSLARGARLLRLLALLGDLTVIRDGDADVWTLVELLVTLESDADNNQRIMITWSRMGVKYGPVRMIGCGVAGAGARMLEQSEMDPALGLNTREPGCIFQVHFEALSDEERLEYAAQHEPNDHVLHDPRRLVAAATMKAVAVRAHAVEGTKKAVAVGGRAVEGAKAAAAAVGSQAGADHVLHKAAEGADRVLRRLPSQRVLNKAAEGAAVLTKAAEGADHVLRRRLSSVRNLMAASEAKEVEFGELFFDAQSAAVANRWVKEIQTLSESVQSRSETWEDEQQYLEKARIARTHDVVGIRKLDLDKTRTYVWESTGSGVAGIEAVGKDIGGGAIGVQVRDLEEVLEGFTGEVWALPLRSAHDQETRAHTRLLEVLERDQLSYMQTLVTRVHETFFKRSYQMNCLKQCSVIAPSLSSIANCCCPCASCNESVFCSEFAVDVYQALGIMSVDIDPEKVIPCDFLGGYAGFPKFGRPIPLRLHQEHMQHAGDHDAFSHFYGHGDTTEISTNPNFHISPRTKLAHHESQRDLRRKGFNKAERLEFDTVFPDGRTQSQCQRRRDGRFRD